MSAQATEETPQQVALYRLFNIANTLLYVGTSHEPDVRIDWHRTTQPWGKDIHHRTIEWYSDRRTAEKAEDAAMLAEHPLHNQAHSPWRTVVRDGEAVAVTKHERMLHHLRELRDHGAEGADGDLPEVPISQWLSPPKVAKMTDPPTTRFTVEREIKRGNLKAMQVSNRWLVHPLDARRWAKAFVPFREQRERHQASVAEAPRDAARTVIRNLPPMR